MKIKIIPLLATMTGLEAAIDYFLILPTGSSAEYCKERRAILDSIQKEYIRDFKKAIDRFQENWDFVKKDKSFVREKELDGGWFRVELEFDNNSGLSIKAAWNDSGDWHHWLHAAQDEWSRLVANAYYLTPDLGDYCSKDMIEECIRKAGYHLPCELLEGVEVYPDLDDNIVKGILVNKGFWEDKSSRQELRFIMDSADDGTGVTILVSHIDGDGLKYVVKSVSPDKKSLSIAANIIKLLKEFEH